MRRMIVAVAGLKGGIGKTLVAVHLAGEAVARKRTTLLADADVQRSALTWADIAAEQKHTAPTVVGVSTSLHKQLPTLRKGYEIVIIDCPPRGDTLTRAAMVVADLVLLPTGPAPTDFWALTASVDLVKEAQALRPELKARILLNRLQARQHLSATARESLDAFGVPVLKASLGLRTAYAESMALGMSVATHSPKSEAAGEVRRLFDEIMEVGRE
jgi:chromosome partitioning protein